MFLMEGIIFLLVIVQSHVSGQAQEATQPPVPLQTPTRDPYANVLSQLSDVVFDVEERLYRLTAPKYDSENGKVQSDGEKHNRRRNYFDRIRDNYKTLQDQLGQSASSSGMIRLGDILNLNFQDKGSRSSLDMSLPFLPLSIQVDSKKRPTKESGEKTGVVKDSMKLHSPFSDVSGNINPGINGVSEKETSDSSENKNVKPELQKRSSRPIRSASAPNKKVSNKGKSAAEFFGDSSKSNIEQPQKWEDESGVQGRILGDLLFSESTYDKYFRRLLKDHGKWLVDSNISPPKAIIEGIRDFTRDQFKTEASSKSTVQGGKSGMSLDNKKEPNIRSQKHPQSWGHDAELKTVLAFTPEGLPFKLKIDPSVNKPLKFLHKILSEAKVSLNIPVSTANGIQPVGNGVLHLGFDDSEMPTRTPLIDLSDNNQLNYLLRTLKKLKYEHH